MNQPKEMKLDIKNCARCGKTHKQLLFKRFSHPERVDDGFEYYALCPTNGEPILGMIVIHKENE